VSFYSYTVYQNDQGTVRHEILKEEPGGANEQGRRAEINNYSQGYTLAFDPGVSQAIRVPLIYPNTTSTPLPGRELLGYKCNGVRREWLQRNHFRDVREIWTPAEIEFKDPLLEVFYGYNPANQLDLVEVRAVRSMQPSPPVAPSLFELFPGMTIVDFNGL
jgi:hypothetical protein